MNVTLRSNNHRGHADIGSRQTMAALRLNFVWEWPCRSFVIRDRAQGRMTPKSKTGGIFASRPPMLNIPFD